jgi:hypothetical protein
MRNWRCWINKFKLSFLLFFIFLSFEINAQGSTETVPWKAYWSESENYNDALELAIEDAHEEALRLAGVKVSVFSYSSNFVYEDEQSFDEVFNSEIFTTMNGGVTDWEFIEKPKKGYDKIQESSFLTFKMRVKVKKYKDKKDPSFKMKVNNLRSSYSNGEYIDFDVDFYEDAYLNVFYLSKDECLMLYPIEGREFANKRKHEDGSNFKVGYIESSTEQLQEYGKLFIVITKDDFPFVKLKNNNDDLPIITTVSDIYNWLFSIEPSQRDEFDHSFIMTID